MSKERPAGHTGKNKVNEFDQDACVSVVLAYLPSPTSLLSRTRADQMRTRALFLRRWSAVFDTMTKEKEQESAESISSREAMKMVHQMLDKMVSSVSSQYPPADTTASILTVLPPRLMRGVVE